MPIHDGYRDGMDAGKEASLQHGFNQGYKEGATRMGVIGQLKGILSALQSWCQLQKKDFNTTARISHLLQEVDQLEEQMTEKLKNCQQQIHMGELTDIIEDMGIAKPTQEPDSESNSKSKGTDYCSSGGEAAKNCCKSQSTSSGSHTGGCQPSSETVTQHNLGQLLMQCIDLVGELGLPAELIQHIHQLNSSFYHMNAGPYF
ncbi:YAED1 protein, partial [Polyodon spathula]|nr:YAED1 protein [Polyodon spathula]